MKSTKLIHHRGNDGTVFYTVSDELEGIKAGTLLADGSVSYAKIQDVSATSRVLGRRSASSGDVEECTLTQVLDFIGSAAQGDILYRGASAWARLGTGTSGQVLTSGGAAANLAWGNAGMVLLTSGSPSNVATLDIVLTAYTSYRGIVIELYDFIPANDATVLYMRFSTDGGANYDATGYNFANWLIVDTTSSSGTASSGSANQMELTSTVGNGSTEGIDMTIKIMGQVSTSKWSRARWDGYYISSDATPAGVRVSGGGARETAQDTDAVRFLMSAGNLTGKYAVYGLV